MNQDNAKINTSSKRFKLIATSGTTKGKFLANWLLTKSYHLEKEANKTSPKFFDEYKKGTVVMVNLGVNIGNEMSNHHFGIILNKDDNKRNGILTILPLSSKYSKHYLKLNDELFKIINANLDHKLNEIGNEIAELDHLVKDTKSLIDGETTTIVLAEGNDQEEIATDVKTMAAYLSKKLSELQIKREKFDKIKKKYQKYNMNSYVCIKNIQTISKCRIITINDLDPSGKIRLSKTTMDKIDLELVNHFTDINLNKNG